MAEATNVLVLENGAAGGIDATPGPPVSPLAETSAHASVDPNTGELIIYQMALYVEDQSLTVPLICDNGTTPVTPTLYLRGEVTTTFPMTETAPSSGVYQTTIPAGEVRSGVFGVHWWCPSVEAASSTPMLWKRCPVLIWGWRSCDQYPVGYQVLLFDPSGLVTDAASGQPIHGAQVLLYRVPTWRPDTPGEVRECRTVNSRGDNWNGEPAADPAIGAAMNVELDADLMSPIVNPQLTNHAGYYGWDVAEGCYYVDIAAEGYISKISPVAGVPPEVTDLDLKLTPHPVLKVTKAGNGDGTVTSEPPGISCGSVCSKFFVAGVKVTFTAMAETGSQFTGWDGACTGEGACEVTVDMGKEVVAIFTKKAEPEFTLYLPVIQTLR
jgi:hypothetical protein